MSSPRSEVHSLFLRPFLDDLRASAGDAAVQSLVEQLGVSEHQLRDETAWVSLELCESFFERLVEQRNDPTLFERCGRLCLQARYLGIIRPIVRAFGSPMFAYTQVVQSTPRFNKVGRMRIVARQRGFVRLEYTPLPGRARERSGLVCQARAGQLAAIPTMFDLAPATTTHVACMQSGSPACIYELAWRELPRRRWSLAGGALGLASGLALTAAGPHSGLAQTALLAGLPLGLWALGRVAELRGELSERAQELHESHEALLRSARLTEDRYAQLLEAKSEVDRKVEDRTRELRETSSQLATTLAEVRALSRAKTDFFANVSHELRTPLTLILAPLETLLATPEVPEGARRYLQVIEKSARQLGHLIDQILDLEKIDAGRVKLHAAALDPLKFCADLLESFHPAARARGLELRFEAPPPGAALAADPSWLGSALNNVLANALRFAREKVVLRLLDDAGAVVFEVEDDGPGVAEADLAVIFERFGQSGSEGERRRGTGLGLAIAREAARLHQGELTLRREAGKGAIFCLRLPRRSADELPPAAIPGGAAQVRPARPLAPDASAERARTGTIAGPGGPAPRVLVVEDEPDLRWFVGSLLSRHYQVTLAGDGAEALALCRQQAPDAIVSDLAMPELTGLELCRQIRADETLRSLPFLLLTAWGDQKHVLDAFEAGADDFIAKPFSGPELLARLDVHLRLRRMVREMAHRERLATLGTMAASLAHQVRNPLTAIRSGVFGLRTKLDRDRLDPVRAREVLEVVADCTARIERVVGALLDLSKLDREQPTSFRPADSIRGCLKIFEERLPSGARVRERLDEEAEIHGRPGDIGHVFLNLIDNAIRAIGEGGEIEIRALRENDAFVFEVGDSGPGVPADQAEWVFSPFTTKRAAGEGTGLGLYLASEVVRQHGGRVNVDRSALGGALFRVELPL